MKCVSCLLQALFGQVIFFLVQESRAQIVVGGSVRGDLQGPPVPLCRLSVFALIQMGSGDPDRGAGRLPVQIQ